MHVSGYVWEASNLLCDTQTEREAFTRARLLAILRGGANSVIRGLRRVSTVRKRRGERRKRISTIAKYLEAHAARMRYDEYLAAGFPIATGVIEGACRHWVKDRMERSGMRWNLAGAKAMLNVRAIHESDCWKTSQEHRREDKSKRYHPHRGPLADYQPLALAI